MRLIIALAFFFSGASSLLMADPASHLVRDKVNLIVTGYITWITTPAGVSLATKAWQHDHHVAETGSLDDAQSQTLMEQATPPRAAWAMTMNKLPSGQPFFVPGGEGWATRSETPTRLVRAKGSTILMFTADPDLSQSEARGKALTPDLRRAGAKVQILQETPAGNLFKIETGERVVMGYFHADPTGKGSYGFTLTFRKTDPAHYERIAILMADTLDDTEVPAKPKKPIVTQSGSGFFISTDGVFITNHHVVAGCDLDQMIVIDGQGVAHKNAHLVADDKSRDLAAVKIDAVTLPTPIRTDLRQGEPVMSYGYPIPHLLSPSGIFGMGYVSSLFGIENDESTITYSAPTEPGNSGGALLDLSGALVGVIQAKLNGEFFLKEHHDIPQLVNFAIRTSVLVKFLQMNNLTYAEAVFTAPDLSVLLRSADLAAQARAKSGRFTCVQKNS